MKKIYIIYKTKNRKKSVIELLIKEKNYNE